VAKDFEKDFLIDLKPGLNCFTLKNFNLTGDWILELFKGSTTC
jgi:hypothetical protein